MLIDVAVAAVVRRKVAFSLKKALLSLLSISALSSPLMAGEGAEAGKDEESSPNLALRYQEMNVKNEDYYLNLNNPYRDDNPSQGSHLLKQTGYSVIAGLGVMVYLWNQPTSFTNWDKRDKSNMQDRYLRNIQTRPRFDDDDPVTNYIGHPYAGASYYVMARQNAFNWYQSFGYSVLMSTFFWEYGLEAYAEVPSSQDLIITPVLGSVFGEGMHQLKQMIKRNDNQLLGSPTLGRVGMWLLDPLGHVTQSFSDLADSTYQTFFTLQTVSQGSKGTVSRQPIELTYATLVLQNDF